MDKMGPPPAGFNPPPPYDAGKPPEAQPQVVVMQAAQFGPEPQSMSCPYCQAQITTHIETSPSTKTHIIALLLCICGCCICAPCVYCADSCLSKKHYCPSCNKYLGIHDS